MAGNSLNQNIAATLNQAVEMQIDAKLGRAQFDATVEGTIVEVKNKDEGKYLVKIQNAKFEAYSTSGTYYEGDIVYINIPRNDYTQQKFIVGRKTNTDEDGSFYTFNFKYPFDDFIPLQNLYDSGQTDFFKEGMIEGLHYTANKAEDGAEPDVTLEDIKKDKNIIWHWVRGEEQKLIGSTLGIQMDWQTFLGEFEPSAGNYGLRFIIRGITMTEEGQATDNVVKEFFFTTEDMYGNPYTFYSPYTQQMLINLSEFYSVEEIAAFFWQDHNFRDVMGNLIPVDDEIQNIGLSGFQAQYGLHVSEIKNEQIYLYTYDSTNYGEDFTSSTPRVQLDTRRIRFAWVHNLGDKNFIVVNNESSLEKFNTTIEDEEKKAHIYWYRQTRSADNSGDGIPYIAPGASVSELEARLKSLEEERDAKLKEIDDNRESYASEQMYNQDRDVVIQNYTRKIDYIKERLERGEELAQSRIVSYAGYDYSYLPECDDCFEITQLLDIELYRERFKAVVAWEGTYEVSQPIVFKNVRADIENNALASQNTVVFRLLREETYIDSKNVKQTKLVEDNSIGNFFVYDENNNVIKNDEERFYSEIYYYIQIWIYSREQEAYVPLVANDNDTVTITWHYPKRATMLKEIGELDASDQVYNSDLIPNGETAFQNIKSITKKFKIDSFWDLRKSDNIITATIERNQQVYVCQQLFQFGQSGSTGSKYTLRVNLINPSGYMMLLNRPFDIEATIYDQAGNKLESPLFTFEYTLLNDGPCKITPNAVAQYNNHSYWQAMSSNGYNGNSIHGVLHSNYPPIFKVTCDLHDPEYNYAIEHIVSFMCCGTPMIGETYAIGCPNRIEYKSDGTIPIYDSSDFEVREIVSDKLIYPKWELEQFQKKESTNEFYKVPEDLVKYVKLDEIYNETTQINTNTEDPNTRNNQESSTGHGYYTYKLNPYATNEGEIRDQVAFFWDDKMIDDTATFLRTYVNGVWVCQALAFAHNTYASSILNSWDGQLLIDKEKNAILARMMAAGTKDGRNRFTGVIMGDWSDYGDSSIDPVGLYGFSHGVQTFGFKTDGTGFIGAAGYGQIKFDGTRALISDYYRDHYINLNPQKYSINPVTGQLTIDTGSYSQYFLYAKNKKLDVTSNTVYIDEITPSMVSFTAPSKYGWINTAWADKFENDDKYDYFVVDPNNGVYMSGGIIARYGMIGKVLQLSTSGLTYQKNNGIIFIGQERARDGSLYYSDATTNSNVEITDTTTDQVDYDHNFWYTGAINFGDNASGFDFDTDSDKIGRYIFWAGEADPDKKCVPANKYPNFGIEHDGTVHLNNAYVQGDIRARSLLISAGDGEYHNINEEFGATYYSVCNPANRTNHAVTIDNETAYGRCHKYYGDLLHKGDLWYNTSSIGKVYDLSTIVPTVGITLNSASPHNNSSNTVSPGSPTEHSHRGYRTYKWVGSSVIGHTNPSYYHDGTAQDNTIVYDGWEEIPATAIETLDALAALGETMPGALEQLAHTIATNIQIAYDQICNGMSPVSFFGDGNCFISVSEHSTTVTGIGDTPAGISIYQVANSGTTNNPSYYYNGASFMLNGQRMGFYQKYTQNGRDYNIPLLAYYRGNMALAGTLLVGLDVTKATNTISGVGPSAQEDPTGAQLGLYVNKLDGPKGNLILGNGAIQLLSDLDNFKKNKTWRPEIILGVKSALEVDAPTPMTVEPKVTIGSDKGIIDIGNSDGGTGTINIGSGANGTGEINIGSFGGTATINLAGFKMIGTTGNTSKKVKIPTTASSNADQNGNFNTTAALGVSATSYENVTTPHTYTVSYGIGAITSGSTETIDGLNKFGIYTPVSSTNYGIVLYTKAQYNLFAPYYDSTHISSGLVQWDFADIDTVYSTNIQSSIIVSDNFYKKDGNKIYELATQKWVAEYIASCYTDNANAASNAQSTANSALGFAKGHTHN